MKTIVIAYLIFMNLWGFLNMYRDKKKAIKRQYRISEKRLFLISILGGSIGSWAGMYVFSHKTKHWYFVIGMPFILCIHIALLMLLYHICSLL